MELSQKIKFHATIAMKIIEEYAALRQTASEEIQIITDTQRGYFQLQALCWVNMRLVHQIIFHFDIKPDGKIWIQANNTEEEIGVKLLEMGVNRQDIVVGFQPPSYRQYSGFAVA